eukprot:7463433-Pyramimonas_sp.AAC.1
MSSTESRKVVAQNDRARARAERMETVAMLRIAPAANVDEEGTADKADMDVLDDSDSRTSARSGRTIRRPAQLSL